MFREQKEELERSNRWAEELNAALAARGARIDELQEELARDQENARQVVAGYNAKVAALEQEGREKAQWALDIEARLTAEIRQDRRCAERRPPPPWSRPKRTCRSAPRGRSGWRKRSANSKISSIWCAPPDGSSWGAR